MAEVLTLLAVLAFYGAVVTFAVAETVAPWRQSTISLGRRWLTNIGLFLIGQLCIRLIVPVSGLAVAYAAAHEGFGLLSVGSLPAAVTIVLGVLLLDVWKYAEHRLLHVVPILWRFHVVHHADVDVDFTTSERHHPLEILVGAGGFLLVVFVGGVPPVAVGVYMLIAGVFSVLTHANIRLPDALDRALRTALITPAVHLVHHSAEQRETDSNFGIVLSLWDRMFETYCGSNENADRARVLGLEAFRDNRSARLDQVLCLPFLPRQGRPPAPLTAPGGGRQITS